MRVILSKMLKENKEKNKAFEKTVTEYKTLLLEREKYRMTSYGFNWTQTGWLNIDNEGLPKTWSSQPLEILVENGKSFDRTYTYVIYSSIKSLYRLNTDDNRAFYVGNDAEKKMLMPKKESATSIAIGYKGDNVSLAVKTFETGSNPQFSMTLKPSSLDKIQAATQQFNSYSKENSIQTDLDFMKKMYAQEQRQSVLKDEYTMVERLRYIVKNCYLGVGLLSR